jgi:hypothetical protein
VRLNPFGSGTRHFRSDATYEEAIANIKEAVELYVDDLGNRPYDRNATGQSYESIIVALIRQ